jgi:hypothetical protein
VKNAIDGLKKQMSAPGINPAKSISSEQLGVLNSIHDDLLRQAALGKGKSIGSNTFQNIATDNILSTMLPGKLGNLAVAKTGGVVGQLGRLAYSGPNEAIRNRLADLTLSPEDAKYAMELGRRLQSTPNPRLNALSQTAARAIPLAPALSSGQ